MQYAVGYEILARAVAFYDGLNKVLRHIRIICKELFGVLWQAIATIPERGVVIMCTYARVKTYAVDYGLRVKSFHFSVCIKLIEIRYAQGKIRVGKQLHGFCFGQPHEQSINVFFYRTFLQQRGKFTCSLVKAHVAFGTANDDAARVKIVVKSLALTQEFRREYNVVRIHLLSYHFRVTYGNGTLNHHYGIRIYALYELYHLFHMACVKIILHRVIIRWRRYYHEVGVAVSLRAVERSGKVKLFFSQILLDVVVLYR